MRRVAVALAWSCLLATVAVPARAGDYYGYAGYRSYSDDGCYRDSAYGGGYSYSYTERPYYRHRYYGRNYDRPYYGYRSYSYRYRPRSYDSGYGYSSYASSCYRVRVRIDDGRGGWVWGSRRVCD